MLFLYAFAFSMSYISLDTATGALILFGAVQITMVLHALVKGDKLKTTEWTGLLLAVGGFVYLLLPGASAPSIEGFVLMTISGTAWGIYTLRGKQSKGPLEDTGYNFLRSLPFLLLPLIWLAGHNFISTKGILLAIVSGALTSGLGYTIWYMALGGLSTVQASVVQLSVPLIAAIGGIALLSERLTFRLGMSAVLILGGILMVILSRNRSKRVN